MLKLNISPTVTQLRQFGSASLVCLPLLAWLADGSAVALVAALLVATSMSLLAWAKPLWLKPVFVCLSLLFFPAGRVMGELTMLILFVGVLSPTGLFFRLIGRDSLSLKLDKPGSSYFVSREATQTKARYYRQS